MFVFCFVFFVLFCFFFFFLFSVFLAGDMFYIYVILFVLFFVVNILRKCTRLILLCLFLVEFTPVRRKIST